MIVDMRGFSPFPRKLTHPHLSAIRLVQHSAAISATAELLSLPYDCAFSLVYVYDENYDAAIREL